MEGVGRDFAKFRGIYRLDTKKARVMQNSTNMNLSSKSETCTKFWKFVQVEFVLKVVFPYLVIL